MCDQSDAVGLHTRSETRQQSSPETPDYTFSSYDRSSIGQLVEHNVPKSSIESDANVKALCAFAKALVSETYQEDNVLDARLNTWRIACQDPPITAASLSQLDPQVISANARLSHDMNFVQDVSYRPNYESPSGQQRMRNAKEFWAAIAVEMALYIQHQTNADHASVLDTIEQLPPPEQPPKRLQSMLKALSGILKTLLLGVDQPSIDEVVDVDFMMRRMRYGMHGFEDLACWLQFVLKRACSPVRDGSVEQFAKRVRTSLQNKDPCSLAQALEELFTILETMKLDVANNQIRTFQKHMISTNVAREKQHFKELLKTDNLKGCVYWFRDNSSLSASGAGAFEKTDLVVGTGHAVAGLVADPTSTIPSTFEHDIQRLLDLRHEFECIVHETALMRTYVMLLYRICPRWRPPPTMHVLLQAVLHRVRQVQQTPRGNSKLDDITELVSAAAILEVVRSAYHTCGLTKYPTDSDIEHASSYIQSLLNETCKASSNCTGLPNAFSDLDLAPYKVTQPGSVFDCNLRSSWSSNSCSLRHRLLAVLRELVRAESARLCDAEPADILSLHGPASYSQTSTFGDMQRIAVPSALRSGTIFGMAHQFTAPLASLHAQGRERSQGLRALALRVAHVSVIHWRVWDELYLLAYA